MIFVFDFDGVLVDSHDLCLGLLRRVHKEMGGNRPIPDDIWDQLEDVSFPAVVRYLGLPNGRVLSYVRRLFEGMSSDAYQPALFEGIDEVLCALAQHGPIAIVSATPASVIRQVLRSAGLDGGIAAISVSRDPRGKAARLPILLRQFRVQPNQAVIIGDAVSDIHAGRANGMWTAAVTWGWQSSDHLASAKPDWMFARVDELLTLPDRLSAVSGRFPAV